MKIMIFLLLLFSNFLFAQNRVIKGIVYSIDTNWTDHSRKTFSKIDTNEIMGASICILKNLDSTQKGKKCEIGTFTDSDGNFQLEDSNNENYLEIQSLGFKPKIIDLIQSGDSSLKIFLASGPTLFELLPDSIPKVNKNSFVSKPAIYIYPTTEKKVFIKHDFKGQIETTYPAYKNGWNVIAKPNGELYNLEDKRVYEYLFWDGTCAFPDEHFNFKNGFVVQKDNLNEFLLEKLTLIGLNNKEINDFIVYWLPVLNKNETNFVHFRINDNIDNTSILHVTPEPDSWIRLFMEFKEVDTEFTISEQELKCYVRKGFTLVEWGGGKIEHLTKIF